MELVKEMHAAACEYMNASLLRVDATKNSLVARPYLLAMPAEVIVPNYMLDRLCSQPCDSGSAKYLKAMREFVSAVCSECNVEIDECRLMPTHYEAGNLMYEYIFDEDSKMPQNVRECTSKIFETAFGLPGNTLGDYIAPAPSTEEMKIPQALMDWLQGAPDKFATGWIACNIGPSADHCEEVMYHATTLAEVANVEWTNYLDYWEQSEHGTLFEAVSPDEIKKDVAQPGDGAAWPSYGDVFFAIPAEADAPDMVWLNVTNSTDLHYAYRVGSAHDTRLTSKKCH